MPDGEEIRGGGEGGHRGKATQGTETAGTCPSPGALGTSLPQGDLHAFGRVLETG